MSHALVLVNVGTLDDLGITADELDISTVSPAVEDLMAPYDENADMPRYRRFRTIAEKGDMISTHLLTPPLDYSQSRGGFDSSKTYPVKEGYDPRAVLDRRVPEPEIINLDALRKKGPSNEEWRAAVEFNRAANQAYDLALAAAYTDEEVVTAWSVRYAVHIAKDGYMKRPSDALGRHDLGTDPSQITSIYEWSRYNPQSKWDWYEIGGRWRGYFVAKDGPVVPGDPGTFEVVGERHGEGLVSDRTAALSTARRTDIVLAGQIDWEGMRAAYAEDIGRYYDECKAQRPDSPLSWDGPQDRTPNTVTRDEYIAKELEDWSPATLSILDSDEGWTEAGTLGWFGAGYDEKNRAEWRDRWMGYVNSLDPNTVLVVVDYHI